MKYKLYTFTGITGSDGNVRAISLQEVIKNNPDLFLFFEGDTFENVNTLCLYDYPYFCLEANEVELSYITDLIEKGLVIVPFSRTFFIMDLIPYLDNGFSIAFMKIKDYKQFKKDYSNSLVTVEDKTTKELF